MSEEGTEWISVGSVSDCLPGHAVERLAGEQIVAIYNVDGQFYALDGICPHQGGPLGKGRLHGCVVTCPWHGWQFHVDSGQCLLAATIRQPTWQVRVAADQIQVRPAQPPH